MSRNITNRLIGNYGHFRIGFEYRINIQNSLNPNCTAKWNQRAPCLTSAICREYSIRNSTWNSTPSSASTSMSPKINDLLYETKKLEPASRVVLDSGKSLFRRQWDAFFNWYDEVSHTNEVRDAHRQVEELQEKLNQAQNLRRDVSKELNDIRYELQMCYADQANCQKGDPRYLELVRREIEVSYNVENEIHLFHRYINRFLFITFTQISNKEKQKYEEFNLLDKAERDLFILMQSAVKTSHEKEKIHTNSAKYWSIVGSLAGKTPHFAFNLNGPIRLECFFLTVLLMFRPAGALLGICGTAFSFYNRNDLLSDINKEFVVIRGDTKSINERIELLLAEQRDFQQTQQQQLLQLQKQKQQHWQRDRANTQNNESWMHWIGRQTYVISIYRYFVPKTVG